MLWLVTVVISLVLKPDLLADRLVILLVLRSYFGNVHMQTHLQFRVEALKPLMVFS